MSRAKPDHGTPPEQALGGSAVEPGDGGPPAEPAPLGLPVEPAAGGPPAEPAAGGPPAEPAAGGPPGEAASGGPPAEPAAGGLPAEPAAGGPPVDPRLLRVASAVRGHLVVSVVCGSALTGLILLQAWLIARVVAGATDGAALTTLAPLVALVAGVAVPGRHWPTDRSPPHWPAPPGPSPSCGCAWSATSPRPRTRTVPARASWSRSPPAGLDVSDDYIARYLPQLVLAVLVPVGAV